MLRFCINIGMSLYDCRVTFNSVLNQWRNTLTYLHEWQNKYLLAWVKRKWKRNDQTVDSSFYCSYKLYEFILLVVSLSCFLYRISSNIFDSIRDAKRTQQFFSPAWSAVLRCIYTSENFPRAAWEKILRMRSVPWNIFWSVYSPLVFFQNIFHF